MSFSMSESEIPDFEDMLKVAQKIKDLSLRKTKLELTIDDMVSKTVVELTTNPEHHINGKPPSMAFINRTYTTTGLDGKIFEYREKLAEVETNLEYYKNKLYIYRDMIDVWRTVSANKRASVI